MTAENTDGSIKATPQSLRTTMDLIPESDPDAFVEDVEQNYSTDRFDEVYRSGSQIPLVSVVSGEYPAFTRFVRDLRPYLFRHGFILWSAREDWFAGLDEDDERKYRHKVVGAPIVWVIAEMNGMICGRGACMNLVNENGDYCDSCDDIGLHGEPSEETIYP